jgi:hypothetical protein
LSQTDLNKLQDINKQGPVAVQRASNVQVVQEREQVRQVVNQERIERHIIPQVTEVREQKVVQIVEQPITRRVIEKPIIREVTTAAPAHSTTWTTVTYKTLDEVPVRSLPYKFDNIPSEVLNQSHSASGKSPIGNRLFLRKRMYRLGLSHWQRLASLNLTPAQNWRRNRLEIQGRYRMFNPAFNQFRFADQGIKTEIQAGYDQFKSKQSYRRFKRYYYPIGTVRNTRQNKIRVKALAQQYGKAAVEDLIRWRLEDPYIEYPTYVSDSHLKPGNPALTDAYRSVSLESQSSFRDRLIHLKDQVKESVKNVFGMADKDLIE